MTRIVVLPLLLTVAVANASTSRVRDGLQVFYDFSSPKDAVVKDRSGAGEPLDLTISNPAAVRFSDGSLEIRSNTVIRSEKPASKIINAIRGSGEISIEVWIRPAKTSQSGPARIVTLSKDPGARNFTLGQDGERFDVRFRTIKTDANGIPSISSPAKTVAAELTHVVYTRNGAGQTRIFVNGKRTIEQTVPGAISNWDGSLRLALGNELTGDRPWLGTFHLVAIYSRRLSSAEVDQNFKAGVTQPQVAQKKPPPEAQKPAETKKPVAPADTQFASQVAPLLSRHCVECHGPAKKKGRLDLSKRDLAFAGGKNGKAIVPGKSAESLLWKKVESDEMPEDSPPLSAQQKSILRQWIDNGANWPAQAALPVPKVAGSSASKNWVRRLTVPEYIETVRSAVGVNIEKEARELLPPDLRADGFNNTAYNLNIDLSHVQAYARLAEIIVRRMDVTAFAAKYAKCQTASEACMRELILSMGKWILRGPVEEHEMAAFLRISTAAAKEGGSFKDATSSILEGMLQSPRFIYRVEKEGENAKPRRLNDYELASRLSYILWGGPPDKELMRAADAGDLSGSSGVEAQVRRMLQDPRAMQRASRFAYEWLNLERLDNLRPDKKRFPRWDSQLAGDMREETLAFFKDIVWDQKRPLWDLMNADITYVTPRLASHYGLHSSTFAPALSSPAKQSDSGLQALYTFQEGSGDTVRDVSGVGEPVNLKITDASAVQWSKGRLTVKAPTLIASEGPPKRLLDAIRKTGGITIEAWLAPAANDQSGPARIVTLSADSSQRNFTLGQNGNRFDVRFRTKQTDANGQPSLGSSGGSVQTRLAHVVYTRDASGRAKLYVNGEQKGAHDIGGDLSNWDNGFRLALANELTKDRPWLGAFHRVAIYNRALAPEEVLSKAQSMSRFDLSSVPARGGLLTHGSILTVGGDDASMVSRGLFILRNVLWGKVDDPPACVDTTPVPSKPGLSRRAIAEGRVANASCGGCHSSFEPLAFGLEKFDGVGAYHEKDEHGNNLREDGAILFPDTDKPVAYKSSAELMDLLAGSDRVRKGMTRKLTQFAIGRPLTSADAPAVDKIHESAKKGGGTYASLITAIVMSDLVRMTQSETLQ